MLGLVSQSLFAPANRHLHPLSPADMGRLIVLHVATEFAVEPSALLGGTRGSPSTALARQVAMYLAHVEFALDFVAIGRLFKRDRTTVAHACRVVENRRDDRAFDLRITKLELLCVSAGGGDVR